MLMASREIIQSSSTLALLMLQSLFLTPAGQPKTE
jgi:hypothetical protein